MSDMCSTNFEEENNRTIFVGNLPISFKEKHVRRLFSEFGPIESVRFRNIAVGDPKLSKKVAFIKSKFHSKRNSLSAYVRFANVEIAQKSLKMNGTLIDDHHVMVDMAIESDRDWKCAIFVGNLSLATEEEDLWKVFEQCGKIKNIRVVRDNATGVCTGVGYVNFENSDSVKLALQLKDVEIRNHILRINKCKKMKKNKKIDEIKKRKYKKPLDKIRDMELNLNSQSNKAKKINNKTDEEKEFTGKQFSNKKKKPKKNKKLQIKKKRKQLVEILNKKV